MPWFELYYHFIWGTLHRIPSITEAVRNPLYATINAKTTEIKGGVLALNGTEDHVHLVVSLPPILAPATFIGLVKGRAAHAVNHIPNLGLVEKFRWQEEYGVLSITKGDLPRVIRYVEEQQEHHATRNLQWALEQTYEHDNRSIRRNRLDARGGTG